MADPEILRGWKEIEEYLRMGRKAIRRAGYPVHFEVGPGVKLPRVYAFRAELLAHAQRTNPAPASCAS